MGSRQRAKRSVRPPVGCLVAALTVALAACGGGGGGGGDVPRDPADAVAPDDPPVSASDEEHVGVGGADLSQAAVGLEGVAALAADAASNTGALDLALDPGGVQHAVMSDDAGVVHYLRCDRDCSDADAWRSVSLVDVDIGQVGYAVGKIAIGDDGTVHVAVLGTARAFGAPSIGYYRCESGCLSTGDWQASRPGAMGSSLLEQRVLDGRWFGLNPDGLPAIVSLERLDGVDGTLFYTVCRRLPCGDDDWAYNRIAELPRALSAAPDLVVTPDGRLYVTFEYRRLGEDRVQIATVVCERDCDGASPGFDPMAYRVGAFTSRDGEIERVRATLDALGRPTVVLADQEPDGDRLVVWTCTGTCSDDDEWLEREPFAGQEGVDRLGRGLDAAVVDGQLLIVAPAGEPGARVASRLLGFGCAGDCLDGDGWRGGTIASTAELDVESPAGCPYVGTEIATPIRVTGPVAGYTLVPTFYCNFVPDDPRLPDASDIRTRNVAAVQQLR